jgi:cytochrome P450
MWAVIGYDYVARVIKDTATLEARVALNVLTKRLPDLELVQGWEPEYLASIVSQGLMTLPVQWKTTGTLNV